VYRAAMSRSISLGVLEFGLCGTERLLKRKVSRMRDGVARVRLAELAHDFPNTS